MLPREENDLVTVSPTLSRDSVPKVPLFVEPVVNSYFTYYSSHRYTATTLYSKRLYIENNIIIINLSSSMKQKGRYGGGQKCMHVYEYYL